MEATPQSIWFVASDAGGMRNVLPVAAAYAQSGGHAVVCVDSDSPIAQESGVGGFGTWYHVGDPKVPGLFDAAPPGGLVVGTTGGASLERTLTKAANVQGVPCVAVLDEWYNYALRFREADGTWILPDRIAAMNQMAIDEAVQEGIPSEKLFSSGSVWLSALAARGRMAAIPGRPKRSGLQVTFISENFTSEAEEIPGMPYDEVGVLRDVIREIDKLDRDVRLINKVHPSMHDCTEEVSGTIRVKVETHGKGSLLEFMEQSDLCIGMKSMGLLEACMLGIPAVSYQPGMKIGDNIGTAVRLGVCPMVIDRKELNAWLRKPWAQPSVSGRDLDFVSNSSIQIILNELSSS